jgi:hypothetical protein
MKYPLLVTREAVDAIEKDTGFVGIGKRMIDAGYWKLEDQCASKSVMVPSLPSAVKQGRRGAPVKSSQA